jgi:hypothetical protein
MTVTYKPMPMFPANQDTSTAQSGVWSNHRLCAGPVSAQLSRPLGELMVVQPLPPSMLSQPGILDRKVHSI